MRDQDNTMRDPDNTPGWRPPTVVTFALFKDQVMSDAHGAITAPVWRAYVDVPSPGFEDIDTDAYDANRRVINAYLDAAQPVDAVGTWYVGKVPTEEDAWAYASGWRLDRFDVEARLDVIG